MPRVSVIIPTYNCARYLGQAIESVLNQTYAAKYVELIVVNDGSTDDTDEVIRPYRSRMTYITQPNRGISGGRNGGVKVATGDYVAFLDADDYWLPERLALMLKRAVASPDCMVMTDVFVLNERSGELETQGNCEAKGLTPLFDLNARDQYVAALKANFLNYMIMVPRDVFARVGLFDKSLTFGDDWDFELRCLEAGMPVRLVPEPLAVYRLYRPGATTTRPDVSMAASRLRILEKHRTSVSAARWKTALGLRDSLLFQQALQGRKFFFATQIAVKLATNRAYGRHLLRQRALARRLRVSAAADAAYR
ncbi:MAG: glycosyltransferase [Candidatus Eremiobacteraeota bacterium]|nr:glycosyltransferase [Candidatus Eremiobacteraeota bacterium]MBC5827288.1 glycosyltransferase [Candidatus Eremiobacteraeota bacterium]